ncbi:hypothetical protein DFH08DRAFT_319218 [Mycena albidolilacea]|uniref:Uncharacterized protein n=1 Tax=Mycena albidolilacea TaxID=1033008 RepID=A0AAD7EK68_9AGAR|nr:hypothetical protein DFH08DRAFT_319218 [Mycena albidolilacea]
MTFECDKRTPEEKEQRGPDHISPPLASASTSAHQAHTCSKFTVSDNSRFPSPDAAHTAKRLRREGASVTTASDRHDCESAEPDDLPTIDEIESCPEIPLPQCTLAQQAAMNSPPFMYPDPADMTGLPAMKDQNPHIQESQPEPAPTVVPDVDKLTMPFTFAIYPRIVIPFGALLNNLSEAQTSEIKANPAGFLAIVPHGTGRLFYQEHKHANCKALAFIKTFAAAGMNIGDIDIALPIPHHKPKSDFDGPWLMIMTGASEELTKFLTWHQMFVVNRKLSFHALRFDPDLDSWVIMTISGDAVREGDNAKCAAMGVIKKKLWHYPRFRALCNDIMTAEGVTGTIDQRVVRATDTFDLTLIHTDDQHGVSTPLYQLTAKPITRVARLHRK